MSATLHLYNIRDDISYTGYYLDFVGKDAFELQENGLYRLEQIEADMGAPMTPDGHWPDIADGDLYDRYEVWENRNESRAWSDMVKHEKLDITHIKSCFKGMRGWKRLNKRLEKLPYKLFKKKEYTQKYVAVDEVEYAQGWFFTKRFFKREVTVTVCLTKEQMINFFNQYIDYNSHDKRGREVVERFTNAWRDGMMFMCAW